MGSESDSRSNNGSGGASVQQVPAEHKKIFQSLKEVVNNGNYTDAEIYAALRDCDMDPNDAVQKLLSQDIFHEVKSKRERRKEMKDTQNLKSRGDSSHLGAKVNAERTVGEVQSQSGYNAELSKAAYRRDNGSAGPVLPSSSLTYEVKTPIDWPSSHSDSFEGKNTRKNVRPGDSSAQGSLVSQSAGLGGSSGHVSMADIVRMRGPQSKGIQTSVGTSSHSLSDANYDGFFSSSLITSPSPPEMDQNVEYALLPNGSDVTRESVTLPSQNGYDNERLLMERRTGHPSTFNCSSSPVLDRFSTQCYAHSRGSELSADSSSNTCKVLEEDAPKHLGMEFVKSVPVSVTSGSKTHLASVSSTSGILGAEGLQQLSLEEKPAEVKSEDKHGVVFPNYMQAFAADCSHLSFGTYKSGLHPPILGPVMSDSVRSNSFAATDTSPSLNFGSPGDSLKPDHLGSTRKTSQLTDGATNLGFPLRVQPELIDGSLHGAAQQHEYFSQLSVADSSSGKFHDNSTSSSIMMHPNALNTPPLHQELHMNSKTLPIELLVSNAESVRNHNDLLSAFGSTQQIPPSRYGSIPPSTGSSSILNPEILNFSTHALPTSYLHPGSSLPREPALPQHVTSQPFSQPALSLEELAKLTGYAALSPNYAHSSSSSLQHAYDEISSFNDFVRIKNLKLFEGDSSRSNFPQPDAADVSRYGGFGRQPNYRGNFPDDLSSNRSASAVGYGDTLRSSFNGGINLPSLQLNDNSSPWDCGPDATTLSAIPDSQYYGLHGYSQLLPRSNKQDQQQFPQDYGALGYGSSYPSQARTAQEQWIDAVSFNRLQDPSSKQQQIWGQNYS
ncbi:unnamed protein product [Linum tenue]|uniref:GBF-interacting protein 1 N-terminal domain-containing protein n=1 Tax=Linum tenue TaxID=586396 RepID=A0AAV0NRE5_9ROSI|nr:unnamed protein product [Linum tenue]